MMDTDTLALNGPLVSELLALLAMLNGTMQCLQDLGLKAQVPSDQPLSVIQLEPLAQQLQQLHRVGLKLSARWDNYQDEDDCKSEFVKSLACEVRNFVSIVLSTMGTLERYGDNLESTRRLALLARVQRAIQDLTCLLEEAATLQGMSGIRTQQARLSRLDVEKLCESVIREKRVDQPERLIRLIRKGKSRVEQVDEVWFRQTLNKVIDNAIAYSPRNSVVVLKLVWAIDGFTIQVQDLGIGIPPEEQSKIFKPFYRANNARGTRSGSGLGLAIAQQAMILQGGSIEIISKVGTGTTIVLRFPCSLDVMTSRMDSQEDQIGDR